MTTDWKKTPAEALKLFSTGLKDQAPDWSLRETITRIEYTENNLSTAIASQLTLDHLQPLVSAYGPALDCKFRMGDKVVLQLDKNLDQTALGAFHNTISGAGSIKLDFTLHKQKLALQWFSTLFQHADFPNHLILYIFPDRLTSLLTSLKLSDYESKIFPDHWHERVAFIAPGDDLLIIGPHLLIIGGKYLDSPPDTVFDNRMLPEEFHQRVLTDSQEALKWQSTWLKHLTPFHLYTNLVSEESTTAANPFRTQFCNLFLLFTADRTIIQDNEGKGGNFVSSYSTSQLLIDINHKSPQEINTSIFSQECFNNLSKLLDWSYNPQWKVSDRLPILQIAVVEALKGLPESQKYQYLLGNSETIYDNVEWHWKAFFEGRISAYTDQIQDLENFINQTVNSYSDQISAVVKGLTDTVLAAVGVVLGSFVAALFKEPFNAAVFRIGMSTYAVYVLLFPLIYNMVNKWGNYRTGEIEFNSRISRLKHYLPGDIVDSIVEDSQVDEKSHAYKVWFSISAGIYLLLVILAIVAAIMVPKLITS